MVIEPSQRTSAAQDEKARQRREQTDRALGRQCSIAHTQVQNSNRRSTLIHPSPHQEDIAAQHGRSVAVAMNCLRPHLRRKLNRERCARPLHSVQRVHALVVSLTDPPSNEEDCRAYSGARMAPHLWKLRRRQHTKQQRNRRARQLKQCYQQQRKCDKTKRK